MTRVKTVYKWLFCFVLFLGCLELNSAKAQATKPTYQTTIVREHFFDNARKRDIPVAFYFPKGATEPVKNRKVVIISHGYGENKPNSYLAYSYIGEDLAGKGYFVISIQHELPTDEPIPDAGKPQVVRRPNWERGAENIRFVIQALQKKYPQLDYKHVTLIGHSNGGDMSMLFAQKYPGKVDKVISLDNRRMPFPRVKSPKIYTLRSNDYAADEGVLPTKEEQKKYGITIQATAINHNNMFDGASDEEKKVLLGFIRQYLEEK